MKKVLLILHVPPPVHGSSIVGKFIMDSKKINAAFNTEYVNLGTSKSIAEIGKGHLTKILIYLRILLSIVKQLVLNRPDLVYLAITAKGIAFYKDMVVVIIVKLLGVRLVLHFHNKGVALAQHKFYNNLLYKIAFRNTQVILLSKFLFYDVEKYVSPRNVHYCPNGVPDEAVLNISNTQSNSNNVLKLLFLSNLIESKGVFVLLDACKILKDKGVKFYCTFVGGEGDINRILFQNKVNKLGINDVINYAGKRYGIEKEKSFSEADIFIFPTFYHNECFPLVLLEAMQHSLPLVSTFEGGIPDIVKNNENGFLIKKNDVDELVDKLEILLKSSEIRKKMGQNGRKLFEENFTIEIFEENFLTILQNLVK